MKTNYNYAPLMRLVEKEVDAPELLDAMDKIDWEYSQYVLKDPDICGAEEMAYQRYLFKCIRDAIRQMWQDED